MYIVRTIGTTCLVGREKGMRFMEGIIDIPYCNVCLSDHFSVLFDYFIRVYHRTTDGETVLMAAKSNLEANHPVIAWLQYLGAAEGDEEEEGEEEEEEGEEISE